MSLDNKTQSYVVNSFLENNSYFHENAKFAEENDDTPQVFSRERGALPRDSLSRIGFFDTRREAAFPQRQSLGEAAQPAGGIPARGKIVPLLRSSRVFFRPIPHAHAWGFWGCAAPPALAHRAAQNTGAHPPAPTKPIAPLPTHPLATLPHRTRRRVPAPRSIPSLPHPPASPCRGASERTAERHSPVRPHRTARRRNPDASARASEHPPARAFSGRSRNVRASERRHNSPLLRRSPVFRTRAAGTGLRPRMTYPRFRYAFPKRGTSAGKGQPQGVPAGALISRS